jgi:hypothetical protein
VKKEKAKAIQEAAKFGSKCLESGEKLGSFLSKVFGTLLSDVVGIVGGDWLHHIRIRNAAKLAQRTEEILSERGILDNTEPMSPSVALPLLHAAQDETRDLLREMWARLLANGMDPKRSQSVRRSIIATIKKLDPLDALVLQRAFDMLSIKDAPGHPIGLDRLLDVSADELDVSLSNLSKLECIGSIGIESVEGVSVPTSVQLTSLGREVVRACSL